MSATEWRAPSNDIRVHRSGTCSTSILGCLPFVLLGRARESAKLLLHPGAPTVPSTLGADLLASRDSERGSLTNKGLVAALLAGSCLSSIDAAAQTWIGADSTYETAANWNPATVPDSGATATFSNTGEASIDVNSALTVGAFAFSANASAYTITNMGGIDFHGAGIQNGSANSQTLLPPVPSRPRFSPPS